MRFALYLASTLLTTSLVLSPAVSSTAEAQEVASSLASLPDAPVPVQESQAKPSSTSPPQSQGDTQKAPATPSLGDLGFSQQQTQADPKLQARLDRRSRMLRIHPKLGLYTLIPMAATLITGPMASAEGRNGQPIKEPTQANLDFHAALGGVTAGMYFSTAYFAMFAPKVPGVPKRGPIRLHEVLAFIHGPGMIATPILGAMAFKQENAGERVHGIASAHGAVAATTVLAYGAAMLAVSWPLRLHHGGH